MAAALHACTAATPPPPVEAAAPIPAAAVAAAVPAPAPQPQAPPPAEAKPPSAPAAIPPPAGEGAVAAVPPENLPGPASLLGLTNDEVADLLGLPGFRRQDHPAEVWQYRGESCILDLFLYKERKGESFTVAHFEVRSRTAVGVEPRACFQGFLKPGRQGGAG